MSDINQSGLPIFDGHNDTFTYIFGHENGPVRNFFQNIPDGHIDLPKANKAGLAGGMFSIMTPPPKSSPESDPDYAYKQIREKGEINYSPINQEYARAFTNSIFTSIETLEKQSQGLIQTIRKYHELPDGINNHVLGVVLHIEGAEAIDKDLSNFQEYYDRGLRALGLVWSRSNDFGCGVPYKFLHSPDTGPGLTDAGRELVKACNRLGIVVDLSHINRKGFLDVAKLTDRPLVVTHTNVHTLCQSSRNLTDEQIKYVGESNGLIGISFTTENINPAGKPDPNIPLNSIVMHIDYVAQKIGVDHVAIGSDFDGAGIPGSIGDATGLPGLIQALRDNGYDKLSLEKIAYKNWLRIFRDTWKE